MEEAVANALADMVREYCAEHFPGMPVEMLPRVELVRPVVFAELRRLTDDERKLLDATLQNVRGNWESLPEGVELRQM